MLNFADFNGLIGLILFFLILVLLNYVFLQFNLKEVNLHQITKEILDAFIYRMIVVDKENVVFVINAANTLAPEDIRIKETR